MRAVPQWGRPSPVLSAMPSTGPASSGAGEPLVARPQPCAIDRPGHRSLPTHLRPAKPFSSRQAGSHLVGVAPQRATRCSPRGCRVGRASPASRQEDSACFLMLARVSFTPSWTWLSPSGTGWCAGAPPPRCPARPAGPAGARSTHWGLRPPCDALRALVDAEPRVALCLGAVGHLRCRADLLALPRLS